MGKSGLNEKRVDVEETGRLSAITLAWMERITNYSPQMSYHGIEAYK